MIGILEVLTELCLKLRSRERSRLKALQAFKDLRFVRGEDLDRYAMPFIESIPADKRVPEIYALETLKMRLLSVQNAVASATKALGCCDDEEDDE